MAGKFRHRMHGKAAIRVKKGMTSESNPSKSRHRTAAQSARAASLMGTGMQAVEDRPMIDPLLDALPMDSMSLGGSSADFLSSNKSMVSEGGMSRLTAFTNCTNPAFDSVHRIWKSGSSMQTEVVSVLAAVAELIKERNGSESDVEYFAALLTALEGSPLSEPNRSAAIAYLLHLIVKRVPKEVLQAQFNKTIQAIYTKLLEFSETADGAVLKNLLAVLGIVFRAQPPSVWQSANTRNMVVSVASFCTHDKPWVRTMSRRVVRTVLTDPVTATENGLHPASSCVGQFCLQQIEEALGGKSKNQANSLRAVRHLCLLEGIMHKMPANLFKSLSEAILKSFAFADPMMKCSALQCLNRALQRQPCDAAMSVETNVLLINALRQLAPPANDTAVCAYWMQALAEAHICLTAKEPLECYKLLPETLQLIVKLFDAASEQLAQVMYTVLTRITESCVQDNEKCAQALLTLLDGALSLQTTTVWKYILRSEMRLFEVAGDGIVGEEFTNAMKSLAQLRESDDCFCKAEIEFTIGSAVRNVGVGHVLDAIPLGIEPEKAVLPTEFSRSWLIPVLRVNIHKAPLALFSSYFLPIAIKIYRRLPSLEDLPRRIYTTLQMQLWELLPSFCETPLDFEKSFPDLAPVLGAAINERKDLRLVVLSALRRLLKFVAEPDANPERMEVMRRYAKNYMPLFFNHYTASTIENDYDDKGVRMAMLETIRAYADATPNEYIVAFVNSAVTKASEDGEGVKAANKRARVLDILCALTKVADHETLAKILDTIQPWLSDDQFGLQKKAYRILEEVMMRKSAPTMSSFFESNEAAIENALMRPLATVCLPARAAFCSSLWIMVDSCETLPELKDLSSKILSSIVLTLDKNNNTHARSNASKCLQNMCTKLIELGAESDPVEAPSAVLEPILSGIFELATPSTSGQNATVNIELARSTLVALNIVAQKQIKVLNASNLARLVSHGCSWIADGRAPVRVLAIRLLRILTQKMPEFLLQQYRDLLLTSVFDGQLTADITSKVRKANRLLLDVLVAKFGVVVLQKYTSKPDWVKQMKNIEKLNRRRERKASGQSVDDDQDMDGESVVSSRASGRTAGADTILELLEDSDESDNDSEAMAVQSRSGASRAGSVWLRDDEEGEVTDLLDRSNMIKKVTTADPKKAAERKARQQAKKNDEVFKVSKDGKLLIIGDEMEDDGRKNRKRKGVLDDGEDVPKEEKRRKDDSDADSVFSDDDGARTTVKSTVSNKSGYQHGGRGIHRDVSRGDGESSKKGGKKGQKNNNPNAKEGRKVEPYAYVPLRSKEKGQDLRKLLKAQRKSGKGKAPKQ